MEDTGACDVCVIGAGVVGLACAEALCDAGYDVVVVERNTRAGQETSARNSGVIHAGIYYPPGSLKAELCVAGRKALYERCTRYGIAHQRVGKLIAAVEADQIARLRSLRDNGRANDAGDLTLMDAGQVRRMGPRVTAKAALFSPETGIVDTHALVQSFQIEIARAGGTVVSCTHVVGLEPHGPGWRVRTRGVAGESFCLESRSVVNAAGHDAPRLAASAGLDIAALGYTQYFCKGSYFSVAPSLGKLCDHLVYPVPGAVGLGIHVTFDHAGRFRLGPDAEYVPSISYAVDEKKAATFAKAVRPFLPEIDVTHLAPDFAGVRPKLQAPHEAFRDFVIEPADPFGLPGLINLIGIESPGLTAACAIGPRVAELVGKQD